MLRESFVLLPRVGRQSEGLIRRQGIADWNGFLERRTVRGLSAKTKAAHDRLLAVARERLLQGDSRFFGRLLPSSEHWRLYDCFRDDACFLDIETGGRGEVTVVGMTVGDRCVTLLRGSSLDKETFVRLLGKAKLLVTFNGRSFDVPVLERYFGIAIDLPHVDLRHVCAAVGLTGGLKSIEKELGILRREELCVLRGAQAPELWAAYHATGDEYYLDLLVKYNEEDCVNLQAVADRVVPLLWKDVMT